jgi:hypothetical protein
MLQALLQGQQLEPRRLPTSLLLRKSTGPQPSQPGLTQPRVTTPHSTSETPTVPSLDVTAL